MIGSATATLDAWPRRTLVRLLGGSPDVGMRQRWDALWPSLASLPQSTLRVLDAGCGPGTWTLEIAARRPQWRVVGIDRIADSTAAAAHAARRLGIANAAFTCADFERFHTRQPFDVVLSVCSAHYLVAAGRGPALFARFHAWLKPGGRLMAILPRHRDEIPFVTWLPSPAWHRVCRLDDLRALCAGAGLVIEHVHPVVGRAGILARQIGWSRAPHPRLLGLLYPIERLLAWADARRPPSGTEPAMFWVLLARRIDP